MATRSFLLSTELGKYLTDHFQEPAILAELRTETAKIPEQNMQIGSEQGAFMALLVKLLNVQNYLEIGVFTGYSSTAVALALPNHGRIVACDVSEEFTALARTTWKKAGVEDKIDLRLAPALETLDKLAGEAKTFDLCFIDADKENYEGYFEGALKLMKHNGLILLDNVLWSGKVADPDNCEETTEIMRRLNQNIAIDSRVESVILPIGDGLTFARVR